MADFEVFRRTLIPLKRDPTVTIQRRGSLSLNKAAHACLGSPAAVELMYDRAARVIGLRPVDPRTDHAYALRSSTGHENGPFVISAMAFLRFYDIEFSASFRWAARMDKDVLCIALDDASTAVTSNRAGSGRAGRALSVVDDIHTGRRRR